MVVLFKLNILLDYLLLGGFIVPLVIIAIGVVLLLIMIMGLKLNTFVSLIIVSFIVGLALGIPLEDVVHSVEAGLGGTLGHIALIFGLGAMLGRLIADAGGAHRIAITLINKFGEKRIEMGCCNRFIYCRDRCYFLK